MTDEGKLFFEFEFEDNEPTIRKSEMVAQSCYIQGPENWDLSQIHPDHLALSSLLIVRPWFNKSLRFSFAVSQRFADACKQMKIEVSPIDEAIKPYDTHDGKYMALAFSGGADSTAALSVLPPSTIPIFMDRPDTSGSLYSKKAALHSCQKLMQLGYDCRIMECDLEMVRNPIGFPTDLANGVPAILMAKRLSVFGISYGTVFESLYGLGRLKYKDYLETSHYAQWWNIFVASGLPISFPTGGISEVGTEIICSKSNLGMLAQSCIRGTANNPCNFCWKCFRKQTLKSALKIIPHSMESVNGLLQSQEVKIKLSKLPISHENVLIYAFSKLNIEDYPKGFVQRFDYQDSLSYLAHWYSQSRELIDIRIREYVEEKIISFIGVNDSVDEHRIQSWDNSERISRLNPLLLD